MCRAEAAYRSADELRVADPTAPRGPTKEETSQ